MPTDPTAASARAAAPDWETSKENVRPERAGRDVGVLTTALRADDASLAAQRRQHEDDIRAAHRGEGPHSADPLAPWALFAKWAVDNYPAGSPLLISVVEKPCRLYAKDARYRDDLRFVRLWVRYADMRSDKLDVFEYMRRHRIGEAAALFYEGWAHTLEVARQYDKAEEVYALGRDNRAKPADRLAQREQEYYKRMAARHRRAEKKKKEKEIRAMVDSAREEQRAEGRERADGRSQLADTVLAAQSDADAPLDENGNPKQRRAALGQLSDRQARTGHRPLSAASSAAPQTARPVGQPKTRDNKPVKLDVYVDQASPSLVAKPQDDDFLPPIPKRDTVSKEDDGPVLKWAGQTMPQNQKLKKRRLVGTPTSAPFQVYSGPEVNASGNEGVVQSMMAEVATPSASGSRAEDAHTAGTASELPPTDNDNVREPGPQSNADISNEAENKEDVPPPNTSDSDKRARKGRAGLSERPRSPALVRPQPEPKMVASPTINTKMAMAEVDDMFNTTLPMERLRNGDFGRNVDLDEPESLVAAVLNPSAASVQRKPKEKIKIYVDVESDKENTGGARAEPRPNPSDIPSLEKRVLQSIPELEGGGDEDAVEVLDDDVGGENIHPAVSDDPAEAQSAPRKMSADEEKNMDFLASWVQKEPNVHLLGGDDPEWVNDMFDLELDDTGRILSLRQYEEKAGFRQKSKVILAEDLNNIFGLRPTPEGDDSDLEVQGSVAVKLVKAMELKPPAVWEYYIYKTLEERVGESLKAIPRALGFVEGQETSFLILSRVSLGSLRDSMALYDSGVFPERVCMLLVADLLRTVERAHSNGVIHGDINLDNAMVRDCQDESLVSTSKYSATGENGWGDVGVLLIDWNHAIDVQHENVGSSMADITRVATSKGQDFRSAEYRTDDDKWAFNSDCYGVAVCAREMLGVTFDNPQREKDPITYMHVWEKLFDKMTELRPEATAEECCTAMRECRELMEKTLSMVTMLSLDMRRLFVKLEEAEEKREDDKLNMMNR